MREKHFFGRPWTFSLSALVIIALTLCACGRKGSNATAEDANEKPPAAPERTAITYYGQGTFLFVDDDLRVVIAPHDDRVGYPMEEISADVVLSRDDPAAGEQAKAVKGNPQIIDKPGKHEVKGVTFRAIEATRAKPGAEPEKDMIYCFKLKDVNYCHLGGLGAKLSDQQVKEIGPVDVVMVPVGGGYTLDAKQAWAAVEQLNAMLILPTHYRTEKTKAELGLETLDPFLETAAEKDSEGKPKALVNRGMQTMMMSPAGVPTAIRIIYVLKPW